MEREGRERQYLNYNRASGYQLQGRRATFALVEIVSAVNTEYLVNMT